MFLISLAAGTSLDKWLKAYKCEVQKAIFPYEWLDDYNKLYEYKFTGLWIYGIHH